ncbi:cadherin-7-like [Ptychodera flava]|uniref:cadherin-7-like n=1 Tax=Ptychodera flava TaxID=63121 RepID=UPI00396A7B5C
MITILYSYSISDASKSTEHFNIDEDTGEITLTAELDRETDAQHTLEILAIDMGRTMKTGTASFTVTVEDVNDNAPMFAEDYRPIVMENGAVGEFVITISAIDRDTAENGPPFTFSTDSTHFYLNQTGDETADLWTNAVFDREIEEFYSVPIVITDVQGLSGTST